jgi:glutathione S-transferase
MFMAEKGIEIPKQTVDLRGGENRQAEHLKRNPHGQMPALELDDGSFICRRSPRSANTSKRKIRNRP